MATPNVLMPINLSGTKLVYPLPTITSISVKTCSVDGGVVARLSLSEQPVLGTYTVQFGLSSTIANPSGGNTLTCRIPPATDRKHGLVGVFLTDGTKDVLTWMEHYDVPTCQFYYSKAEETREHFTLDDAIKSQWYCCPCSSLATKVSGKDDDKEEPKAAKTFSSKVTGIGRPGLYHHKLRKTRQDPPSKDQKAVRVRVRTDRARKYLDLEKRFGSLALTSKGPDKFSNASDDQVPLDRGHNLETQIRLLIANNSWFERNDNVSIWSEHPLHAIQEKSVWTRFHEQENNPGGCFYYSSCGSKTDWVDRLERAFSHQKIHQLPLFTAIFFDNCNSRLQSALLERSDTREKEKVTAMVAIERNE